ncbi:MAG: HAD family hydrolase, partial [bacterium]
MKLAIFDIDGTLTQTNHVDSICFVQALADEFGIDAIDTNWANYPHTTDSGIMRHIFLERFARLPSTQERARFRRRFVNLLEAARAKAPESFHEVPGATAALQRLRANADWVVAIATGGWRVSALFKLSQI